MALMLEISHGPILDCFSSLPIYAGVDPDYHFRTAAIKPRRRYYYPLRSSNQISYSQLMDGF